MPLGKSTHIEIHEGDAWWCDPCCLCWTFGHVSDDWLSLCWLHGEVDAFDSHVERVMTRGSCEVDAWWFDPCECAGRLQDDN